MPGGLRLTKQQTSDGALNARAEPLGGTAAAATPAEAVAAEVG
jgi:hypothetical protein